MIDWLHLIIIVRAARLAEPSARTLSSMSSAPLSAASAARARNRQAAGGGQPVPSSTSRSRDAASALSDRRRRRRGEDDGGTTARRPGSGKRSASTTGRSENGARDGGNPFAFTPVPQQRASSQRRAEQHENLVRGILHKRRDHLTYGSSAWRPRLFVLDKSNKTLTYYLLSSSSRRREADNSRAGGIPTTPIPVRSNADSPSVGMQTPAFSSCSSSPATTDPHPLDATIDALSLDVNPRGVISLRNCIVRAVDDASVDATMRTPGRPRNLQQGGHEGRLFGMVLSPKRQRRQGGSANAATASEIKNDIYLATATEDDRNQWLRHLAVACGMATSPVPGGLRSASAPPPSVGRRREAIEAREEQVIGGTSKDGSNVGGSGEVKDTVATDTTRLPQTPEMQRNRPPPSAVATPVTLSTPLRSAARRIFSTPSAVASESEAGSSTVSRASITSRLGTSAIGGVTAVKNTDFSVSNLPFPHLVKVAGVLLAPPIFVRFVRIVAPLSLFSGALPQLFLFIFLVRWSIQQIVLARYLGRPLASRGALHGPVACRIAVDLRGVLRFIGNKREERTPLHSADVSSSLSHVSVTHIVAKAVAAALSEVAPELNCRYRTSSLLGIQGWYQDQGGVTVSVVSTSSQRVSTVEKAEDCTVQEIADQVWKNQREETDRAAGIPSLDRKAIGEYASNILSFLINLFCVAEEEACSSSCLIYSSPDSENNEVDIDVAPRPESGTAPIVVIVGGVRVIDRDPRNASSRQSRRPMLSVSITIDCPMSSIAKCRKFAEKVQTLIQFPEMCE